VSFSGTSIVVYSSRRRVHPRVWTRSPISVICILFFLCIAMKMAVTISRSEFEVAGLPRSGLGLFFFGPGTGGFLGNGDRAFFYFTVAFYDASGWRRGAYTTTTLLPLGLFLLRMTRYGRRCWDRVTFSFRPF